MNNIVAKRANVTVSIKREKHSAIKSTKTCASAVNYKSTQHINKICVCIAMFFYLGKYAQKVHQCPQRYLHIYKLNYEKIFEIIVAQKKVHTLFVLSINCTK